MSEVVVVVTLRAKAGQEDALARTLTEGSGTTHGEPGCVVYAMHQGADDPGRFAIVECWSSQEDLDRHLELASVQEFIGRIDALADGQPDFGVYAPLAAGDPAKGVLSGRA
jgi:quinol monooxygenase YgiN